MMDGLYRYSRNFSHPAGGSIIRVLATLALSWDRMEILSKAVNTDFPYSQISALIT